MVSVLAVVVVLLVVWVVRVVLARDYHALVQATQRVTGSSRDFSTATRAAQMQMAAVPSSRNSVARRVPVARSVSTDSPS